MNIIKEFQEFMKKEGQAIIDCTDFFGKEIENVVDIIEKCQGKVIISGVGKSGHIGEKIAATMSSTGTPCFFMHSTEGVHGDLGMVEKNDVIILISNSGETKEVLNLLPSLIKIGCKKIAITKSRNSNLAKSCDEIIAYTYSEECDHLQLAPTVSSTITLAVGDALALTLSKRKNFTRDNFHLYHPGGSLGKKLEEK